MGSRSLLMITNLLDQREAKTAGMEPLRRFIHVTASKITRIGGACASKGRAILELKMEG